MAASLTGGSSIVVAAAFCTAAPWMQAIGRLRCLVEGRGFGRPALSTAGIVYREPRTLPARNPGLRERPLHPTPIYSILWSIFTGIVLARMWWVGCPLRLIAGVYLLLWGMGRFVEEAYRHCPTQRTAGKLLPMQWLAAAVSGLGALVTALPLPGDAPSPQFSAVAMVIACVFGVIGAASLGVEVVPREREAVAHSGR
jgi:prolipoprotein diacylglyceryltransferase